MTAQPDNPDDGPEALGLFQGLRAAIRREGPLDLLTQVSAYLAATDPRNRDPFHPEKEHATLDQLVDSLLGASYAETTAALLVIRAMTTDQVLGARIAAELARRRQPMPDWLHGIDETSWVGDIWLMTHVLGDGDDYLFGARLPTGEELSVLIYVDHNMGTVVKDAFVVEEPLNEFRDHVESLTGQDQSLVATDPQTARAILAEAIAHGAMTYPPIESDTWPMCRPLVEWLLRLLPDGGVVPARPQWSENELERLTGEFFASQHGTALDHPDERDLLESVLWFGTDYGPGDPLRWSPVNVEILLADWVPRKIVAESEFLAKLPNLLRGLIRFSHEQRGINAGLTAETLAAVDVWEPDYQRLTRSDRPQGAEALLASVLQDRVDEDEPEVGRGELFLQRLDRAVGGRDRLVDLDVEPLPDEQFEWTGIADDVRPRVQEMLDLCDGCADELLDVEHRTAMRRFLSRAAVADPATFRRKASPARGAAAVAWVICSANESLGRYYGPLTVQELLVWFGLTGSVSQRAEPLLRANGVDPHRRFGSMDLGTPDLLTSQRRQRIIERRDAWL